MKSFGIWYSCEERKSQQAENGNSDKDKDCKETVQPFQLDLHINLWDIGYDNSRRINPFIDIGLSIKQFRNIDCIYFLLPFVLNQNELIDLTDTFSDHTTANLVFNDDCRYENDENNVSSLSFSETPHIFLYKMKEVEIKKSMSGETALQFNLKIIRDDHAYDKFHNLYIRFRIKSCHIKEELFCKIKKKNWFLESGFNKTQIIDIKFNKQRNMCEDDLNKMRRDKFVFAEFDKVHLLVMEPANNGVEIFSNDFMECRKLEDEWGNYLKKEPISTDILAYHWKAKKENGKLREYSEMVKITSATTSWGIITGYIVAAVIIGVVTNACFTYVIQPVINYLSQLLKL